MKRVMDHAVRPCFAAVLVLMAIALSSGPVAAAPEPGGPGKKPKPSGPEKARIVPEGEVERSATVETAAGDTLLSEEEREKLRLFHGYFDDLSEETKNSAAYALATWDLNAAVLEEENAPLMIRAEAAHRRGEMQRVLDVLGEEDGPRAALLRGRALAGLGRYEEAIEALTPLGDQARAGDLDGAAAATAGAEAIALLARLEGRPAADYERVMRRLSGAQQRLDRLYWPALIAQGRLLLDKDNPRQAVKALRQALRLNPGASEAWYLLGRAALSQYDFDSAERAIQKLRDIQPEHVLADILEIESYLTQKDPRSAADTLESALKRYPRHRRLLACRAAVAALQYKPDATEAALEAFDDLSGENPLALYLTGKYLSMGRQYEAGAEKLRAAIERQPNWPAPQVELGLLLNQAGREKQALKALRRVSELDPFNKQAANTLKLLDELADYERVETEHFIIKYRDPIDAVLAADMPPVLERIHDEVSAAFSHEPERKTLIEILPDKRWFAVRITGMPWIWTIGASTGPVIAITPPRIGSYQSGGFDWQRVIRHEYTHTITLARTRNRIPHWFTEACAVSQEPAPRDYRTAKQLAAALKEGNLFDLESINWAFVRPEKPGDRGLAYAQSYWMYEYLTVRFGHQTILDILDLCRRGVPQAEVVPRATGQSAEDFLDGFKKWARGQVDAWGLSPSPPIEKLLKQFSESKVKSEAKLEELLGKHPDHPGLLKLAAGAALKSGERETARRLLLRYSEARPIDPWADRKLANLALRDGRPADALPHLQRLDLFQQRRSAYARDMLKIDRELDRPAEAQRAAASALARAPYDPKLREIAATLALRRGEAELALRHLQALTLIEPDRAIHFTRLAALSHRLGHNKRAEAAARRARELNPEAPVEPFLDSDADP